MKQPEMNRATVSMRKINLLLLPVLGITALMRRALGAVLLIALSVVVRQAAAQDDESWEKIRDTSPDKNSACESNARANLKILSTSIPF
jgi:hypothetical protein